MQHKVLQAQLKNGAQGLFIDVPGSSVTSMDIVFRAGDYLSPNGKMDTAHVMEHLVLGANDKYPSSREFSHEFTKYGAYNNAYTGDYHMGYEAECEASESERILDLLCIAIECPLFTEEDFKSELGNVREELKMRRNNNDSELSLSLENAMGFVPKSYTQRAKELDSITLDDIKNHYNRTHQSSNLRFVISGPISSMVEAMKTRLSDINLKQGSGLIDLPKEEPKAIGKPLLISNPNLDNVCYRWEAVLPKFTDNISRDSINALNDILFSGFHSKVFGELREKGLVYGIFGNYYETNNNAVSVINGQVQKENIELVFKILHRELLNIANNGVDEKELSELKRRSFGEVQRYHQTPGQLNNWYRLPYIMRGEISDLDSYEQRLSKITSDSVSEIANSILSSPISGLGLMVADNTIPADKLSNILIGK
jgi:predicted Zn-dependent peptidase